MTHPTEVKLPESLEVAAWVAPNSAGGVLFGKGWMFAPIRHLMATMPLVRLSDAESALKARDAEIERLRCDAERMDWLMQHTVNVRVHLRYGSRNLFWAGPEEGDGEILPSNLRAAIDQARATGGEKTK